MRLGRGTHLGSLEEHPLLLLLGLRAAPTRGVLRERKGTLELAELLLRLLYRGALALRLSELIHERALRSDLRRERVGVWGRWC